MKLLIIVFCSILPNLFIGTFPAVDMRNSLKLNEELFITQGFKDSLVTIHYPGTQIIRSKGLLKEGNRVGPWDFYNWGELDFKFDFSEKKVLYFSKRLAEQDYSVILNGAVTNLKADQPPVLIPSENEFQKEWQLQYPLKAKMNEIQGTVKISMIINEEGVASDFKIVEGIGAGCDEEVVRLAKQSQSNWQPALKNNKPVPVKITLPFKFVLR